MFATIRIRSRCTPALLVVACLSGGAPAAGQVAKKPAPAAQSAVAEAPSYSLTPGYSIKPSEVLPPTDVPLGQYRRMIRPFRNWTLICDENLKAKQRVCNISQTIVDAAGQAAFSWSLAATTAGVPFMILRAPPSVGAGKTIELSFDDGQPPIQAGVVDCNGAVCVAYLPIGPRMRGYVGKKAAPEISYVYMSAQGEPVRVALRAPLDGLSDALAAI